MWPGQEGGPAFGAGASLLARDVSLKVPLSLFLTVALTSGLLAATRPASALSAAQYVPQPSVKTNVVVDTNQTLFTVLAAINVAGYDDGLDAAGASPLRKQIRAKLLAHELPVYNDLRVFYKGHLKDDPAANLSQYISLAIFLGDPPDFKLQVRPQDLPGDVAAMQSFIPLLRRFYEDAGIGDLWRQVQPQYDQQVGDYASRIRTAVNQVNDFFRLPGADMGRRLYIYPDALASPRQSNARSYLDNYFIVTSLSSNAQVHEIRHIYLHYILDSEISQFPGSLDRLKPLLPQIQRAPALPPAFKQDVSLFYTECVVRAVEIVLDGGAPAQQMAKVQQNEQEGYVLTRYWYDQLLAYHKDVVSFREFYPEAAWGIQVESEVKKAKETRFVRAPVETEPAQPVRLVSLLNQGEARLQAMDFDGAERLARQALMQPQGDHATAHYLLALVATHHNQPELARDDFGKALAEATPGDIHVRTWANIYLGRIDDLEHNRAEALKHYQAALAVADTPSARQIAEAGLKAPFQSAHAAKP